MKEESIIWLTRLRQKVKGDIIRAQARRGVKKEEIEALEQKLKKIEYIIEAVQKTDC